MVSWRTQWLHLRGPITLNLSSRPLTTLRLMTAVVKIQTRWVVLGLRGKFWVMSRFWQQVPQLIGTDPNTVETSGLVTHLSTSAPLRRGNKSNRYRELLFGSLCMNGLKIIVDNIFLPSPRTGLVNMDSRQGCIKSRKISKLSGMDFMAGWIRPA